MQQMQQMQQMASALSSLSSGCWSLNAMVRKHS
jgi:hypothetical protein